MSDSSDIRREIEAEAGRLFPDAVRRVEWLRHGDAPVIEPGELETVDRLITTGVAPNRAEALRWALGRVGQADLDRARGFIRRGCRFDVALT